MRPGDAQLIQEARERARPIRDGECFRGVGRRSGAWCVPRHNMEAIRQTGELTTPAPRVAEEPVQQDQGFAAAGRAVRDGLTADSRVEDFLAGQDVAATLRFSPFRTAVRVCRMGRLNAGSTL